MSVLDFIINKKWWFLGISLLLLSSCSNENFDVKNNFKAKLSLEEELHKNFNSEHIINLQKDRFTANSKGEKLGISEVQWYNFSLDCEGIISFFMVEYHTSYTLNALKPSRNEILINYLTETSIYECDNIFINGVEAVDCVKEYQIEPMNLSTGEEFAGRYSKQEVISFVKEPSKLFIIVSYMFSNQSLSSLNCKPETISEELYNLAKFVEEKT